MNLSVRKRRERLTCSYCKRTGVRFWKVPVINGPARKAAVDVYIQGRDFKSFAENIINFSMFSSTKTITKQNGMILLLGLALFFFKVDFNM